MDTGEHAVDWSSHGHGKTGRGTAEIKPLLDSPWLLVYSRIPVHLGLKYKRSAKKRYFSKDDPFFLTQPLSMVSRISHFSHCISKQSKRLYVEHKRNARRNSSLLVPELNCLSMWLLLQPVLVSLCAFNWKTVCTRL